jgi:hypothetical protein
MISAGPMSRCSRSPGTGRRADQKSTARLGRRGPDQLEAGAVSASAMQYDGGRPSVVSCATADPTIIGDMAIGDNNVLRIGRLHSSRMAGS